MAFDAIHPLKPCAFAGAVPGTGADVVDANDGSSVGPGVTGELVMRTPSIGLTRGLWHERERY
jgi:acetyl-CoA synthetase